ncbi:MAG: hypothetical protein RBS34_02775 [Desulfofustis sp.]|jgi:hypothetical protein|nr:hypothetical protein [Desulfofustis sp.]
MIPRIFRWDDGNAPVLNGVAGSLINLLTKCLIDGYGDQLPVGGWTREFVNVEETKAVFRGNPLIGTGFFLRVDDTFGHYASCNGLEVATDLDTGTGLFSSGNISFYKSGAAGTTPRPWLLAATDTFFYLFVYFQSTTTDTLIASISSANRAALSLFIFGDFLKEHDEAFNCIIGTGRNNNNTGASSGGVYGLVQAPFGLIGNAGLSGYVSMPRSLSGAPDAPTSANILRPPGIVDYRNSQNSYYWPVGPAFTGRLYVSSVMFAEDSMLNVRGTLPGLYFPLHGYSGLTTVFSEITAGGRSFIVFPACGYQSSAYVRFVIFLLEIGADWS